MLYDLSKKHKKQISAGLKTSPLNFTLPEVRPPAGTDCYIAVAGLGIAVGGLAVAGRD